MAVVVLYPCSQFDYLTSGRTEMEAQELFESWVAAHHPALFERDAAMPRWETASYPTLNLQQDIVIVPPCCESFWNDDWDKQTADCMIIRNADHREEIVRRILAACNRLEHGFGDDFVADCYALGVARLLMALLNQQSPYLRMPDESRLKASMTDAIQAVRNDEPNARHQALQHAFDEIASAKESFYPTQHYFIELTLATATTVGEPMRKHLLESPGVNLFMPNDVLQTLPETHPETFAQLQSAIGQHKVRLIADDGAAGAGEPLSLALLPILDVADHILAGVSVYHELLNVSPKVYGRLAGGLTPVLPQLLKFSGMTGVLHFAPLTGWRIKETEQSKIAWQGTASTTIDALVRYPVDASKYLSFFELAEQFRSQLSQDSVPTSVLARFPGQQSAWLDMLRRMTRFNSALGKFVHVEEYFSSTSYSGGVQRLGYERYPVNALTEAEQNPISRWHEVYKHNADRLVQSSLEMLVRLTKQSGPQPETDLVRQFVEAILPASGQHESPGAVVVNPLSFARKMFVNDVAVDVPPLGYAYVDIPPKSGSPPKSRGWSAAQSPDAAQSPNTTFLRRLLPPKKNVPVLARQATDDLGRGEKRAVYLLENRYFSAKFDAATGTLRSIFTNRSRYNQLSRQIAFRKDQTYSIQTADDIIITKSTTELGQLKIVGRLVHPDGNTAARFTEMITIRSQSRVLEFDLTLEPELELDADRWNSYLAVRYAWNDDTLDIRGGLHDGTHPLPAGKHLHSPKFVDLRNETGSLTFLSEGLPFHRRSADRQLDTLLMVQGESQRQFRLGIAVNAEHPVSMSYDFMLGQEEYIVPVSCRVGNPSAWLFQIASHHVLALYWEPILESDRLVGYTVYLQETEGRRAHFAFHSFVPPKHASATDFQGKECKTFKIDADAVLIDMHAHELLPLMVRIV